MKKLYLLIFSLQCFLLANAQNFHPFPYDSVFFETTDENKILLPIIKTNDQNNMLMPIHNEINWRDGGFYIDFDFIIDEETTSHFFPYQSWLGKVSFADNVITFETALENQIPIDLSHSIGESDTTFVQVPGTDQTLFFNVKITYHEQQIFANDTIKSYRFELLDENYLATEFYDSTSPYNIENHVFRISKNYGILSAPAFYYFPNSLQYHYKAPIGELLDLTKQHAYDIFKNEVSDEIHTKKTKHYFLDNSIEYKKKIYVDQEYDEMLNAFISVIDVWTRKDSTLYLFSDDSYEKSFTTSFQQVTDTTYLDDFPELNKIIPNGFPTEFSSSNTNGFFYRATDKSFMKFTTWGTFSSNNEGVYIELVYDGSSAVYQFQKHTGGMYYGSSITFGGGNSYEVLYYKFENEIWGTPISNSYILDVNEEQKLQKGSLITGETFIKLNNPKPYESGRIYNLNGQFIRYLSRENLQSDISTNDLKNGLYVLICWTGETVHRYKFLKS